AFNMGIGMVFIVDQKSSDVVSRSLRNMTTVYEIGEVVGGDNFTSYL
ncbi:uncharacterized protein METZ01_LOCUS222839, partial [marine metagenome]